MCLQKFLLFPFLCHFSVQMPANWEATTAVVTVPKMLDMDINTRRKTAQEYVLGPPGCSLASRIAQFNGTAYFLSVKALLLMFETVDTSMCVILIFINNCEPMFTVQVLVMSLMSYSKSSIDIHAMCSSYWLLC